MPSGMGPGATALLVTVGSNDDDEIVTASVAGGFEFRARHIHAPATSANTPNAINKS